MTRTLLAAICVGLFLSSSLVAQSRGGATDPITGTWAGELVPRVVTAALPVTLQLKFDGKECRVRHGFWISQPWRCENGHV